MDKSFPAKENKSSSDEGNTKPQRKPYLSPVITEWGTIKELTQGGDAGASDGVGSFLLREEP